MSDGLLNDMLNMQIICTFNVELEKLDNALLGPGATIARKKLSDCPNSKLTCWHSDWALNIILKVRQPCRKYIPRVKDKDILIHNVDDHDA